MKKIVLIEDEEFIAEMYQLKFTIGGYKIKVAYNGKDGLKLINEFMPDLILLDLVLPQMDGYDVLEKLKSNEETKDIKVIILSNLGQAEEVQKGIDLGAVDFFIKAEYTPADLLEKIKKYI